MRPTGQIIRCHDFHGGPLSKWAYLYAKHLSTQADDRHYCSHYIFATPRTHWRLFTLVYSFAVLVVPIYVDLVAVIMAMVKTQPSAKEVQAHWQLLTHACLSLMARKGKI